MSFVVKYVVFQDCIEYWVGVETTNTILMLSWCCFLYYVQIHVLIIIFYDSDLYLIRNNLILLSQALHCDGTVVFLDDNDLWSWYTLLYVYTQSRIADSLRPRDLIIPDRTINQSHFTLRTAQCGTLKANRFHYICECYPRYVFIQYQTVSVRGMFRNLIAWTQCQMGESKVFQGFRT